MRRLVSNFDFLDPLFDLEETNPGFLWDGGRIDSPNLRAIYLGCLQARPLHHARHQYPVTLFGPVEDGVIGWVLICFPIALDEAPTVRVSPLESLLSYSLG